ncbi:hypothetical protein V1514DRAFT_335677 [Lipomyces japonicus]|uniref:uncharacterized protein n=1 Tax=Lipomyces japonicus TaxID=56871 RepID=UPI0034CF4272
MTFLKSLASSKGDLSSITAPPFILSATSLTEYSRFWAELPSLFVAPSMILDPEERALAVLRWFIATLKGQYSSRNDKLGSEKKPLNPFLGEVFLGKWETEDEGTTVLVSEQVSHHPPVTAYAIYNDVFGVELQGYNGQKASFATTTITVKQVGHAVLYLKKFDEYYYITLPSLHIEGLIYAAPYVELEQSTVIQSSSGFRAEIEYTGKGYFSGKKSSFKAKFYGPESAPSLSSSSSSSSSSTTTTTTTTTTTSSKKKQSGKPESRFTISGQWSGKSTIRNDKTKKESVFYDTQDHEIAQLVVKPIESQAEYETRRAWSKVADAVKVVDYDTIHVEKSKIEVAQRELRKRERDQGVEWQRRYFKLVADQGPLRQVAESAGVDPDDQVWRFDRPTWDGSDDSKL